ncbi:MAG: hypothetical protein B7Y99_02285 [Caulobacterales bacterium 32-69-10]|nr:MAG: hypothetical protein B7Y99_02285 [Caulobacterales bacterium 32-69-10]
MLRLIAAYAGTALVFLVLDAAWLSFAANRLYRPILGDLLAPKINLAPGAVFYLIYIAGILALAVWPALKEGVWSRATLSGAMLGFVAYATYDLTNQATLRTWSTKITLADMGWGAFVTGAAATAGFFIARSIKGGPA